MNKNHMQADQISESRKMAQNHKTLKEISQSFINVFLQHNLQIHKAKYL